MKEKYKKYFIEVTRLTSQLSTCISKQVGSILVKNNRIIATSYNGVPSGLKHCNQIFNNNINKYIYERNKHHAWSNKNELHSEANIISYSAKNGININESIMFTSLSPCITCAKMILASGIKEVYYLERYDKDVEGIKFLKNNGVKIR